VLIRDVATARYYLNNVELGTAPTGTVGSVTYPLDKLVFGTNRRLNDSYFDGTIDDIRVYNRALSICEINRLYTGDTTVFQTSLIFGQPSPEQHQIETYSVTQNPGSTYLWTVMGGSVVSGNSTNSVDIQWGATGPGNITVTETDSIGCIGAPSDLPINILGCTSSFQTGSITGLH